MMAEWFSLYMILGATAFAFWCKREIPRFAVRINRQVYEEYAGLVQRRPSYADFCASSQLQPKQTVWANAFFLFFPLSAYLISSPLSAFLLMVLFFLAVLDYCYYLTDIRGIALVFSLSLAVRPADLVQDSMLFCILLFGGLTFFYRSVLDKDALGSGDSLLFIALSPQFSVEKMLLLIFMAAMSGLCYYLFHRAVFKRWLDKLPFIPFIALSTFILIVGKISVPFSG